MAGRVDAVLRGGSVVDGSGSAAFHADVIVHEGRILDVRESADYRGDVEVDCTGRVVCPGFIDVHAHDDLAAVMPGGLDPKIAQGVTSTIVGNCGHGVAPSGRYSQEIRSYSSPVLGAGPDHWPWPHLEGYLSELRGARPPIRVQALVPHGVARMSVMGFEARPATPSEVDAIVAAVRKGLDAGAIGVSFGLMYAPACFADTTELVAVAREAAQRGGVLSVHLRAEGQHILQALAELHEIVVESGVSVHVSHLKCTGASSHGQMGTVIGELDRWRAQGIAVTGDVYPYTAGSTTICAMLPEFALEGGVEQLLHRLQDDGFKAEVEASLGRPWERVENHLLACGADNIVLTGLRGVGNHDFEGRSVGDVARARSTSPEAALLALVMEEKGRAGVIQHQGSEDDLLTAMAWPHTMIGSDGLPAAPGSKPHPRLFGTFPRVLGHYVRGVRHLPLEEAVHRMTGLPAQRFHLPGQGTLEPGTPADLVVFDPAEIRDRATYEDPRQSPQGVDQVWVQGRPLVAAS
jgi:N-acyl-D-amino-acid deacylase